MQQEPPHWAVAGALDAAAVLGGSLARATVVERTTSGWLRHHEPGENDALRERAPKRGENDMDVLFGLPRSAGFVT
jgi:hypothetical protein